MLEQKQKLTTISEEIVLKSKSGRRWEWTTGAFGFYQWLTTNGPVTFKEDGVTEMLEKGINSHFPDLSAMGMKMNLNITNPTLLVDGRFHTPILSGAVYHQSTFRDLLIEGLSATVGLRLDYEKNWMKYNSGSTIDYQFNMTSPFHAYTPGTDQFTTPERQVQQRLSAAITQVRPAIRMEEG